MTIVDDTGAVDTFSVVVTDLDGTLWQTEDVIHPRTLAAVHTLEQAGVPLLVATGRRTTSTRAPLERLGLAPSAIVLNGALGLELATSERFHRAPFPDGAAGRILAVFAEVGLEPCVYVDAPDAETYLGERPSTNPGHQTRLAPTARVVPDLWHACARVPVLAFGIIGIPHGRLVPAVEQLGRIAEVHLDRSLDFPGMASLTVAPRRQSKWDGVLAYCRREGIDPGAVVAIGDGPNDVELLSNAAISLVPRGAHPSAVACADRIVGDPRDGGWADVLDLM
ncbi:MAG TPA: HAD family hydrolase [Euzebyales bacterium]|nr:HAD family hydrolase [Euzebyales bacterium]